MRGAAAPASFSLGLPSTLLAQTRSPGMNASSRRARRKRGWDPHIVQRVGWRGSGLARARVRPLSRRCR